MNVEINLVNSKNMKINIKSRQTNLNSLNIVIFYYKI